ncbi:MAG: ParB/RepB/Spo0J family partition protein [Helicobacteraceae bacterium]|nr:ParB/RepB/Spo0J family partition protein [Helicobacteraceae bacterium]
MALGRGLGELLGEMEEDYDNALPQNESVLEVQISSIKPNPHQPRKTFNQASLNELADSIKEHGLLQPIVVISDIDGYVLVAGERRLRASKLAKLKTIKAVVTKIDDNQMRQHALVENIQRDQLNAIELAYAYEELLKIHDITHDELSNMVHKSRTHITNSLRLLQLCSKAQKALVDGKISAGHAKVIVSLSDKEQGIMVDSIIGQKLSVRDIETIIKSNRNTSIEKIEKVEKKSYGYDFSRINYKLKECGLKHTTKSNKLTIEFKNDDEIISFLDLLS